jgi:Chaperonin 10 Kd subunit
LRVVEGVNPSRPHVTSGNRYQRIGRGRVSDDGETIPLDVQAGEYVLIGKYSGTEIKLDGEDYLIVRLNRTSGTSDAPCDSHSEIAS